MGKRLISQRRGKGTPRYVSPRHRFEDRPSHRNVSQKGEIVDIIHDPARQPPLAVVEFEDGRRRNIIAPEGVSVGEEIEVGEGAEIEVGNTTKLKNIPEGVPIYNLELKPNDGGKVARTAGSYSFVISQSDDKVIVKLPSGDKKELNNNCRATIGVPAGSGMNEKPFLKAGSAHKSHRARGKLYPKVSGVAMNAVDHPFGGSKLGRSKSVSRNKPPGSKAGSVSSKSTGKKEK